MDFIDLKTQYRRIQPSVDARIHKVLEHGAYVMGPEVGELEQVLASYCGTKHCVSVASGTDALMIDLSLPFPVVCQAEILVFSLHPAHIRGG